MNREESIALYEQGKDAWNEWAEEMLTDRRKLVKTGDWEDQKGVWNYSARTDFVDHTFSKITNFNGFIFPSDANFSGCIFEKKSNFCKAIFWGYAAFNSSRFLHKSEENQLDELPDWTVDFQSVNIKGVAFFVDTIFNGAFRIDEACFEKITYFGAALFKGVFWSNNVLYQKKIYLDNAVFEKESFFSSSQFYEAIDASNCTFTKNVFFDKVHFGGWSKFDECIFKRIARFDQTVFHNIANFSRSVFESECLFIETQFKGESFFEYVEFSDSANFAEAIFNQGTYFHKAKFLGFCRFGPIHFKSIADFTQVAFRDTTIFRNAVFSSAADFCAITVEDIFTLDGTSFLYSPDFRQAHFKEAPDLDNIVIHQPPSQDPETAIRYRALKKLAIQGHNHEQELNFFAGELTAKGSLFGRLYGLFSDYGRSLSSPFFGWIVTMLYAAMGYHSLSLFIEGSNNNIFQLETCSKTLDAFELALRKGLLALGWEKSSRLDQIYSCLYGKAEPAVSFAVSMGGLVQTVLSAVFIFLFLLALRNRFRIK